MQEQMAIFKWRVNNPHILVRRQGEAVLVHDPVCLPRRRRARRFALLAPEDEHHGPLGADEVVPAAQGRHHRLIPPARRLPAPVRRRRAPPAPAAAPLGAGGRPNREEVLLPLACAWISSTCDTHNNFDQHVKQFRSEIHETLTIDCCAQQFRIRSVQFSFYEDTCP